jgi:hypothetical protein
MAMAALDERKGERRVVLIHREGDQEGLIATDMCPACTAAALRRAADLVETLPGHCELHQDGTRH